MIFPLVLQSVQKLWLNIHHGARVTFPAPLPSSPDRTNTLIFTAKRVMKPEVHCPISG